MFVHVPDTINLNHYRLCYSSRAFASEVRSAFEGATFAFSHDEKTVTVTRTMPNGFTHTYKMAMRRFEDIPVAYLWQLRADLATLVAEMAIAAKPRERAAINDLCHYLLNHNY